jgi:hypothetical protein
MLLADVNVVQSQAAFEAVSDSVNRVLLESLTEGWDVPDTAAQLNTVLTDFAPWQATRLARTSLISLANGSSLLAAQALGADAPTFKTWLTAGDELVRPTHVEADRQTVPTDQPFDVDGVPMMFPGDPSAPDALKQNCRCTLVYGSDPHPLLAYSEDWLAPPGELALSAAFDPAKHPRNPATGRDDQESPSDGGKFAPSSGLTRRQKLDARRQGATLHDAFHDKIGNRVYVDKDDNYRYRLANGKPGGDIPPWNDLVKAQFGTDQVAFHNAANEYIRPVTIVGAGWDESRVSRNPSGEHDNVESPSDGGKFRAKHGATGTEAKQAALPTTAAEAGRRVAASVILRQQEGLALTEDAVRALPIPEGEYAGETVYMVNGGGTFNRLPTGSYIIDGAKLNDEAYDATRYATADEAIEAMRARLARPELAADVAKNWAKRLRGGVMNDKEVLALFTSGDVRNATSGAYQEFTSRWGVDRTPVIVLNEKGMAAFGKDIFTHGFYDPGTGVVYLSGENARVGLDLVARDAASTSISKVMRRADGTAYDYGTRVGKLKPGGGSGGTTIDGLIRHETAHAAWARMPQAWRDEFTASVPADYAVREQLTRYAADAPEVYGESMRGADATLFPWQGEVHSEVAAVTMDPEYDPKDWPAWVNEMGVRIREARP